jgi:hypothetical protein
MPTPDPDDDDFELELEPVDPEVLAHSQRRVEEKTDEALRRVDVDEIVGKRGADGYGDYDVDWSALRQFRFTTRHLLIATAVLAFCMTLYLLLEGCMAIFVGSLIVIGFGWFGVYRIERREKKERERLRREIEAALGRKKSGEESPWTDGEAAAAAAAAMPRKEFRFAFSLKQVFIAMTVAAIVLGVLTVVGLKALTITLGACALAGLAVQTFGWFDPPPAVILAWWMMLVLYLALGLLIAKFPQILGTP